LLYQNGLLNLYVCALVNFTPENVQRARHVIYTYLDLEIACRL